MTPEKAEELLNTLYDEPQPCQDVFHMKNAVNYAEDVLYIEWSLWVIESIEAGETLPIPDSRAERPEPEERSTPTPMCTVFDESEKLDIVLALPSLPDTFTVQNLSAVSRVRKRYCDCWAEAAIAEGWLEYVDPDAFEGELCKDTKEGEKVTGTVRVADWGLCAALIRKLIRELNYPRKGQVEEFAPTLSGKCSSPSIRVETTEFDPRVLTW